MAQIPFVGRSPQSRWLVSYGAERWECWGGAKEGGTCYGVYPTVVKESGVCLSVGYVVSGLVRLWYITFRYFKVG